MRHSHSRNFGPIYCKFEHNIAYGNPVVAIENILLSRDKYRSKGRTAQAASRRAHGAAVIINVDAYAALLRSEFWSHLLQIWTQSSLYVDVYATLSRS